VIARQTITTNIGALFQQEAVYEAVKLKGVTVNVAAALPVEMPLSRVSEPNISLSHAILLSH